jgi:cell division protein FtsI (penicillin-binding protein 3)
MLRGAESPPSAGRGARDAATRIAQALNLDANELHAQARAEEAIPVAQKRASRATRRRSSATSATRRSRSFPFHGITVEGEGHRYYPGRELAGPVLGFVAPDGEGKGRARARARRGAPRHVEEVKGLRDSERPPALLRRLNDEARRSRATTSPDAGRRNPAHRRAGARRGAEDLRDEGASIVVVDPNTGEIYAMASTPGVQPQRLR